MTSTLTQRLQRAVVLRDAATAGEWRLTTRGCGGGVTHFIIAGGLAFIRVMSKAGKSSSADAAFIAAAPSIVQLAVELGAECERLRAALSGAAIACMEERVDAESTGEDSDRAYNMACEDCHDAILRMLKEIPNAE